MEKLCLDDDLAPLVVIGAGPHALSLLCRLIEDEPDLFTEAERTQMTVKAGTGAKGRGPFAAVRKHLSRRVDNPLAGVRVLDAHGGWLAQWRLNFAALEIAHLRSHADLHPCPYDWQSLRVFAEKRPDELWHMQYLERDEAHAADWRGPFKLPDARLFLDFCDALVERYGLRDAVETAHVASVGVVPPAADGGACTFVVRLADGREIPARRVGAPPARGTARHAHQPAVVGRRPAEGAPRRVRRPRAALVAAAARAGGRGRRGGQGGAPRGRACCWSAAGRRRATSRSSHSRTAPAASSSPRAAACAASRSTSTSSSWATGEASSSARTPRSRRATASSTTGASAAAARWSPEIFAELAAHADGGRFELLEEVSVEDAEWVAAGGGGGGDGGGDDDGGGGGGGCVRVTLTTAASATLTACGWRRAAARRLARAAPRRRPRAAADRGGRRAAGAHRRASPGTTRRRSTCSGASRSSSSAPTR